MCIPLRCVCEYCNKIGIEYFVQQWNVIDIIWIVFLSDLSPLICYHYSYVYYKKRDEVKTKTIFYVFDERKKIFWNTYMHLFRTFWTNCEQSIVQWNIFNANCRSKKTYRDIYCIWTTFWSKIHYYKFFETLFIAVHQSFHFQSSTKMTFIWICL